jgi:HEAT repeat protein
VTEEIPLQITCRLLTEEELAKAAKAEEDARKEKERPLTEKEVADALADLQSKEASRVSRAAKLLAQKGPSQPNPAVAKALEQVLLAEDKGACGDAAKALKTWSVAESVPSLLRALSVEWEPARADVIEAMIKYKPEAAIGPVAQLLPGPFTRDAAGKFLKAMGPAAEDAVLANAENNDDWVRAKVCEVLKVIGTGKSIPVLEKLASDKSHMVDDQAREALDAIKLRQQLPPEAK